MDGPTSTAPLDADAALAAARRPLVIGIGGGGDVVGALATAEVARLYHGARPVVGGMTWERRAIDPDPGPRAAHEVADAQELAPGVLLAGPETRIRTSGIHFAEARMAELLGEGTVLVDPTPGPAAMARSLAQAAERLGADLVVFIDVGGDVLAHGDEPGLGSPLCDALMLAAAGRLARRKLPVLGGVFGPGCDGELTVSEVMDRLASVAAVGGLVGARGITPAVAERLERAVESVPTEASAQAVRSFRGVTGAAPIRRGERTVELTLAAAVTIYFDVLIAIGSVGRLARAVDGASTIDEANDALHALGVRTELDLERGRARHARLSGKNPSMPAAPRATDVEAAAGPVLGVDVGGTKVAVARVDGAEASSGFERPTDVSTATGLLDGVEAAVEDLIAVTGHPAAVGVGVPSQIDYATGRVVASSNIPLHGVPLHDELTRRLGTRVFIDNDANCAALAESRAAKRGPARSLVMLTLGTGVGGGVVIDGRIFRGASGLGAELGHVVINENGPECPGNCPSRGCLEAYCSGQALGRDATEAGRARPDTPLGRAVAENGSAGGRDAVAAARAGDEHALRLLERLGTHLGVGIAGIVNTFEPELVVVGGGLAQAGDLFLDVARDEAAARALPAIFERVSIELARAGPAAGVIGAGLLAAQELQGGDTAAWQSTEGGT
jgi:glucokinase